MEDVTKIPLPCGRVATVPASEYERLMQQRWGYDVTNKVVKSDRGTGRNRVTRYLHREVMGNPVGRKVKARDKDYLNCTFGNLYLVGQGTDRASVSRKAWKENPGTYRNSHADRDKQFYRPLVHIDIITGEVLAWNLGGYRSTYV